MNDYKTIAESNNFIVLDKYTKVLQVKESYQSEYALEAEFVTDLQYQGYEYLTDLTTPEKMLANVRVQLQAINQMQFSQMGNGNVLLKAI
jgi:type I restriction enzyme R subunit